MLVNMAPTRLASGKIVLEAFVTGRTPLEILSADSEFNSFFAASSSEGSSKRKRILSTVHDATIYKKERKLLEIFNFLTRYLRYFDLDDDIISDVLLRTEKARVKLSEITLSREDAGDHMVSYQASGFFEEGRINQLNELS